MVWFSSGSFWNGPVKRAGENYQSYKYQSWEYQIMALSDEIPQILCSSWIEGLMVMGKRESTGLSRLMKGSVQSLDQLVSSCGRELTLSTQLLFNSIFLLQWSLVRGEPWLHLKRLWEVHSGHHLAAATNYCGKQVLRRVGRRKVRKHFLIWAFRCVSQFRHWLCFGFNHIESL